MTHCPCGSGRGFEACCGPVLAGAPAPTAEALMRSRYSAFARADVDYLESTLAPEAKGDFNRADTEAWAKEGEWLGLEVRAITGGTEEDDQGSVEFVARYRTKGQPFAHHELASFRKDGGRWVYVDGILAPKPPQRVSDKVGRNDPCRCGSGKKYKKCCGA